MQTLSAEQAKRIFALTEDLEDDSTLSLVVIKNLQSILSEEKYTLHLTSSAEPTRLPIEDKVEKYQSYTKAFVSPMASENPYTFIQPKTEALVAPLLSAVEKVQQIREQQLGDELKELREEEKKKEEGPPVPS